MFLTITRIIGQVGCIIQICYIFAVLFMGVVILLLVVLYWLLVILYRLLVVLYWVLYGK